MYHVSAQGVDERMINVHYYYLVTVCTDTGTARSLRFFAVEQTVWRT